MLVVESVEEGGVEGGKGIRCSDGSGRGGARARGELPAQAARVKAERARRRRLERRVRQKGVEGVVSLIEVVVVENASKSLGAHKAALRIRCRRHMHMMLLTTIHDVSHQLA